MHRLTILLAGVCLLWSSAGKAASINPSVPVSNGSGGFTYAISVPLGATETVSNGAAFGVFDVGPVFNVQSPSGFSVSTPLVGTIPGSGAPNDATIADLIFTYSGAGITGGTLNFSFDALTASYHFTNAAVHVSDGGLSRTFVETVLAPNAVPEPGTVLLSIAGLAGLLGLRRKRARV